MKEATGELNMTVVTIVAIAALVAFFYFAIWPTLQSGMTLNSACNSSHAGQSYYKTILDDGTVIECGPGSTAGAGRCQYGNDDVKQCD